jgi:uncharacterized protein YecT (DUF1311 family)
MLTKPANNRNSYGEISMFKSALIVTNAFFLAAIPVLAQDCSNAVTQPELNKCAEMEYTYADKRLNIVYDSYRNILDENGRESLLAIQRQWLKFRDLTCEHEIRDFKPMTYAGAGPMVHAGCLRSLTEAQTKLIQGWLEREK